MPSQDRARHCADLVFVLDEQIVSEPRNAVEGPMLVVIEAIASVLGR